MRWEVLQKRGVRTLERRFRCRFIPQILALSAAAGWELLSLTVPQMRGCGPETPQRPLFLAPSVFVFERLTVYAYLLLTCLIQCANCSDDPNTRMHENKHTQMQTHTEQEHVDGTFSGNWLTAFRCYHKWMKEGGEEENEGRRKWPQWWLNISEGVCQNTSLITSFPSPFTIVLDYLLLCEQPLNLLILCLPFLACKSSMKKKKKKTSSKSQFQF